MALTTTCRTLEVTDPGHGIHRDSVYSFGKRKVIRVQPSIEGSGEEWAAQSQALCEHEYAWIDDDGVKRKTKEV